ncbi:DUF1173 family protein [Curvibacter sp. APW13]|uniref:DUF1173 family protein n=1 Tax=Curvibacter sp. APW13 TaxID=3077236 RepID=UPI0028E07252|nr:DUF1173 family protein [Curvibacter sp. APW13]MDT8992890.1 DUF1173 family protein [Curvibacter sp. APW13]
MNSANWQEKLNRVRFGDRDISRTVADTNPAQWQQILQNAYVSKDAPPLCLCQPQEPVAMYIARLGDTYVLKRRPKTGHLHHSECDSHGGISKAANDLYSEEAIVERADGKVNHSLSVPLSTIEHIGDGSLDEAAAPPRPHNPSPKRPSMTLRGFLNLLWEEAGLASWSPGMRGKRTLTRVYWRLNNELADRLVAGDDATLRVFIPTGYLDAETEKRTRAELLARFDELDRLHGTNHKGILIIVGELRNLKATARNVAMRLKGLPDSMPIWTPPGSIERLRTQWPAALERFERSKDATTASPDARPNRLLIIAGVQLTQQGNLNWRYGAAMETTEDYIPIDSQYEARIANALVQQHRRFEKPLRYDGVAATFADFVLTDMPQDLPMEIYGFSGPEYEARKAEKIALYTKEGKPFWQWDVSKTKLPPPFPMIPPKKNT